MCFRLIPDLENLTKSSYSLDNCRRSNVQVIGLEGYRKRLAYCSYTAEETRVIMQPLDLIHCVCYSLVNCKHKRQT